MSSKKPSYVYAIKVNQVHFDSSNKTYNIPCLINRGLVLSKIKLLSSGATIANLKEFKLKMGKDEIIRSADSSYFAGINNDISLDDYRSLLLHGPCEMKMFFEFDARANAGSNRENLKQQNNNNATAKAVYLDFEFYYTYTIGRPVRSKKILTSQELNDFLAGSDISPSQIHFIPTKKVSKDATFSVEFTMQGDDPYQIGRDIIPGLEDIQSFKKDKVVWDFSFTENMDLRTILSQNIRIKETDPKNKELFPCSMVIYSYDSRN